MSPSVHKTPQAERDLIDCAMRIAEGSVEAAERFLDAVEQTFALLASMPHMGQACEFRSPRAQGLRRWRVRGFENYLIFYRPHENGVAIIRVLYGARDLESIFEDS